MIYEICFNAELQHQKCVESQPGAKILTKKIKEEIQMFEDNRQLHNMNVLANGEIIP